MMYARLLIALALLAASFGAGVTFEHSRLTVAHQAEALRRAEDELRDTADRVAEHDRQQERLDAINRKHSTLIVKHAAAVADSERQLARLRLDVEAFAAGSAQADLSACRERAGAVGRLLGEALQASAECASDGELDRATARTLWDAEHATR